MARRRWPQERVWAGGLPARHRPGWTDVSAARHDRAAWQVKLLVDHRERLVAERPWTSNRLGWQLHQLDLTWEQATRPKPRHSTAWLARAPQEASRSLRSARPRSPRLAP